MASNRKRPLRSAPRGPSRRRTPKAPSPSLPSAPVWTTQAQLAVRVERDGYLFFASMGDTFGRWNVVGIVTPLITRKLGEVAGLEAIFANHGHQVLGLFDTFDGPDGAKAAAERFVLTAPAPERCECEAVLSGGQPP